jgi:hypothetical protein
MTKEQLLLYCSYSISFLVGSADHCNLVISIFCLYGKYLRKISHLLLSALIFGFQVDSTLSIRSRIVIIKNLTILTQYIYIYIIAILLFIVIEVKYTTNNSNQLIIIYDF